PGVIDFQDAVRGAITYDLVSLLRDSYIAWPRKQVESWVADYYAQLKQAGVVADIEWQQFLRWFDWMGVQRHIKVVGIFSRLNYRDGKPSYLADIPLTLNYIKDVTSRYRELAPLYDLVSSLK
ncbi:MAG TPA: phosphotransferase, partial [Gammaproteobacteria bacterium]|nr:phosphotransferase [Gammaproteobacteria bacterium]